MLGELVVFSRNYKGFNGLDGIARVYGLSNAQSLEQEFINRNKENISRELLRRNFINKVYNSNILYF